MTSVVNKVDVASMLDEGEYYVLENYAQQKEIYPKVVQAFLDGIEGLLAQFFRDIRDLHPKRNVVFLWKVAEQPVWVSG